jgi:hypothetical protein
VPEGAPSVADDHTGEARYVHPRSGAPN